MTKTWPAGTWDVNLEGGLEKASGVNLPKKPYPAVMPCIDGSVELILEQRAESIVYDFQSRCVCHNRG